MKRTASRVGLLKSLLLIASDLGDTSVEWELIANRLFECTRLAQRFATQQRRSRQ